MTQRLTPGTIALLATAPLLWAGNAVVGRMVHTLVPPVTLNFIRWALAFLVLLPLAFLLIVSGIVASSRPQKVPGGEALKA
ncbi:hypothetical protein AVHM3334_13595 [Acidovorax sp. SUPP3334]|nr:hypothetical protein AVHM3334_13595 [Acidovorax sp. SUPP3334]